MFFDCLLVRNFWYGVEEYLKAKLSQDILLSKQDVIFGRIKGELILNKIILYGKHFICNCKINYEPVNVINFITYFEHVTEMYEVEI